MLQTQGSSQNAATPGTLAPTQYLTFLLGNELFAIGILAIKEIIEYPQVTAVPLTPAYLRGVMNLRGAGVPVTDLAVRFGRSANPVTKRTCVVILEAGGAERRDVGIVVDAVNAVIEILPSDVEAPPSFGTHIRTDFIAGMGKLDGKFVMLLDVERILADDSAIAA